VATRYNAWAKQNHHEPLVMAKGDSDGVVTTALFEAVAEKHLIPPTFIHDFPADVSPLSKRRDDDPTLAERFEIFAGGLELGNAYSELNDPAEQEQRFREQVERGGEEAPKEIDWDYVRALCHGLPPTGGWGFGIDRFTMLLTNTHSIREVILFPLLRPEQTRAVDSDTSGES
jgi:lysyl-tRNA synthetase class 2